VDCAELDKGFGFEQKTATFAKEVGHDPHGPDSIHQPIFHTMSWPLPIRRRHFRKIIKLWFSLIKKQIRSKSKCKLKSKGNEKKPTASMPTPS
jgi:hypothetical protein